MAQTTEIKNSWSLIAFARQFGKMAVGECVNHDTAEVYKACTFTKDGIRTFVSFSRKLGELSPMEIAKRQHSLQVVQLESGNYKLCAQGESSWQDVDLDI